MRSYLPKTIFILTGASLWLVVGNVANAGFVSLSATEAAQGNSVNHMFSSSGASTGDRQSDENQGDKQHNQDPVHLFDLNNLVALAHNGGAAGSMSSSPTGGSGGTTFVAVVAADSLYLSPHLIGRLVVESASRPPAPFLTGVFRPPRNLN